jgi:hypothetical protein
MYVINCTRFDIAYSVSKLSRFIQKSKYESLESNKKDTEVFEVHFEPWTILYWSPNNARKGIMMLFGYLTLKI